MCRCEALSPSRGPGPFPLSVLLPLSLLLGAFSLVGCAGEGGGDPPQVPEEPQVWRLSGDPVLEIGAVEGEEPYQLHQVGGAVRLSDGRILVSNTGSRELRLSGGGGDFLESIGKDGEGPGEFRAPTRIRKLPGDTVMVWDQALQRVSIFDARGRFLAMAPLPLSSQALFPGDEWLMGRNWVDSPIRPRDREPVRRAVESLPPPDSLEGLRFVKVTNQGWLWVSPVRPPADSALTWSVYDLEGRRRATVTTPPRFEPYEMGQDYVLGRYQDSLDVNYVRLYEMDGPRVSPGSFVPSLPVRPDGAPEGGTTSPVPAPDPEVLAGMQATVKIMASLQEIHYSEHFTYTTKLEDLGGLRRDLREEVGVEVPYAGTDGWMVILTHRPTGKMCVLAYGYCVPMGWSPGRVICP